MNLNFSNFDKLVNAREKIAEVFKDILDKDKGKIIIFNDKTGTPRESSDYAIKILELLDDISFYRDINNDIPNSHISGATDLLDKIQKTNTKAKKMFGDYLNLGQDEQKVNIAVIGAFSAGKSQLINSLLGKEDICPVDVAPTTSTITKFVFAENKKIFQIMNNKKIEISDDEYLKLSRHNPKKFDEQKKESYEFEYHYPFNEIRNIALFDTPGFNANNKTDEKITLEKVKIADVIIFVMSIKNGTIPASMQENIEKVIKSSNKNQKWFLIMNKADLSAGKPEDDARKIKNVIDEMFRKDFFQARYLYSAKKVFEVIKFGDKMEDLKNTIKEKIQQNENFDYAISIEEKKKRSGNIYCKLSLNNKPLDLEYNSFEYSQVRKDILKMLSEYWYENNLIKQNKLKFEEDEYRKDRVSLITDLENLQPDSDNSIDKFNDYKDDIAKIFDGIESSKIIDSLFSSKFVEYFWSDKYLVTFYEQKNINRYFKHYKERIIREFNKIEKLTQRKSELDISQLFEIISIEMFDIAKKEFSKYKNTKPFEIPIDDYKNAIANIESYIEGILQRIRHDIDLQLATFEGTIQANVATIDRNINDIKEKIEKFKKQKHKVKFSYKTNKKIEKIYLLGDFNKWKKKDERLLMKKNVNEFCISLFLPKGRYKYKFLVDDEYIIDKLNEISNDKKASVLYV